MNEVPLSLKQKVAARRRGRLTYSSNTRHHGVSQPKIQEAKPVPKSVQVQTYLEHAELQRRVHRPSQTGGGSHTKSRATGRDAIATM